MTNLGNNIYNTKCETSVSFTVFLPYFGPGNEVFSFPKRFRKDQSAGALRFSCWRGSPTLQTGEEPVLFQFHFPGNSGLYLLH